jgi:hypothetical protein
MYLEGISTDVNYEIALSWLKNDNMNAQVYIDQIERKPAQTSSENLLQVVDTGENEAREKKLQAIRLQEAEKAIKEAEERVAKLMA